MANMDFPPEMLLQQMLCVIKEQERELTAAHERFDRLDHLWAGLVYAHITHVSQN